MRGDISKIIWQNFTMSNNPIVLLIKNLKLKIHPDSERRYNSPWNIVAKFNLDMSFLVEQIAAMLQEYESDNHTGMDIGAVSQNIYDINDRVVVANRIFEMRFLNMLIVEETVKGEAYRYGERDKNQFIRNNSHIVEGPCCDAGIGKYFAGELCIEIE